MEERVKNSEKYNNYVVLVDEGAKDGDVATAVETLRKQKSGNRIARVNMLTVDALRDESLQEQNEFILGLGEHFVVINSVGRLASGELSSDMMDLVLDLQEDPTVTVYYLNSLPGAQSNNNWSIQMDGNPNRRYHAEFINNPRVNVR